MNRDEEARDVGAAAVALPPDHATPLHQVWLASDAAAAGDIATAQQMLANVHCEGLHSDYRFLATCAQAVIDMALSPAENDAEIFRDVMRRMRAARAQHSTLAKDPQRKRIFRRSLWEIARRRGTWWGNVVCCVEWLQTF
jgi:ATP/maltotriose-dependent transcriptional regulator MalT